MKTEDYPICWNCDCMITDYDEPEFCPNCGINLISGDDLQSRKEDELCDYYAGWEEEISNE